MKTINYTIKDNLGIHARPAGALVKEAGKFKSELTISKGEKTGDLKKIFSLMGLNIRYNDTVTISANGEDEDIAIGTIENFLKNNL